MLYGISTRFLRISLSSCTSRSCRLLLTHSLSPSVLIHTSHIDSRMSTTQLFQCKTVRLRAVFLVYLRPPLHLLCLCNTFCEIHPNTSISPDRDLPDTCVWPLSTRSVPFVTVCLSPPPATHPAFPHGVYWTPSVLQLFIFPADPFDSTFPIGSDPSNRHGPCVRVAFAGGYRISVPSSMSLPFSGFSLLADDLPYSSFHLGFCVGQFTIVFQPPTFGTCPVYSGTYLLMVCILFLPSPLPLITCFFLSCSSVLPPSVVFFFWGEYLTFIEVTSLSVRARQ